MIRNSQKSLDILAEYIEDEIEILNRLNAANIKMNENIPVVDCFDPICLFESRMIMYEMQKRISAKNEDGYLLKQLVIQKLKVCSINELDVLVEEFRMHGLSLTIGSLKEKIKLDSLKPEECTIIAKCLLSNGIGEQDGKMG